MIFKYFILLSFLFVNSVKADWIFEKTTSNGGIAFSEAIHDGGNATILAMCIQANIKFTINIPGTPLQPTFAILLDIPQEIEVQFRIDTNKLQQFSKQILTSGKQHSIDVIELNMNNSRLFYEEIINGKTLAMKFITTNGESLIIRSSLVNAHRALKDLKKHCELNYQDI